MTARCQRNRPDGRTYTREQAIDEVRADNIIQYCKDQSKDPVVMMMTEWYDAYERNIREIDLYHGFEKQVSSVQSVK